MELNERQKAYLIENARELLASMTQDLPENATLFGVLVSDFDESMLRMAVLYLGYQWNKEQERHSHNLEFLSSIYKARSKDARI